MQTSKLIFIIISFTTFIFSSQTCQVNKNDCLKCNPRTNLCAQCSKNILQPDEKGGCEISQKCNLGQNYCKECDSEGLKCSLCELGFFPDEIGGCSFTDNCKFSYKGNCFECKNDFALIGNGENKICKYKYTDDLINCNSINLQNGICESCNEGFYLNSEDKKCNKAENCMTSIFGVCTKCINGYYLDKRDDKCYKKTEKFTVNCKQTIDGKTCDECEEGSFFSQDGKCIYANYCKKTSLYFCAECIDGFYLASDKTTCTDEKNCAFGDLEFGFCKFCQKGFYIDLSDGKCKNNQENNEYKNCNTAFGKNCTECVLGYHLADDGKCSKATYCKKTENGECVECYDNYFLAKNNVCTKVEKCEIADYSNSCEECENGLYYNGKKCVDIIPGLENCKKTDNNGVCKVCKNNFYLNVTDKLCYNNENKNDILYKCATINENNICEKCENNYYLGSIDKKCSKIENCAQSENGEICIKCENDHCFDLKKMTCENNINGPVVEEKNIYYNCNITNSEGTECAECKDDYADLIGGLCVNFKECELENEGKCEKCVEKSHNGKFMCINDVFGCIETNVNHCLKCNNMADFNECTECEEGYESSRGRFCVKSS